MLRAVRLRAQRLVDPLGLDAADIDLSWNAVGRGADAFQTAVQVRVERVDTGEGCVIDTGRVDQAAPRIRVGAPPEDNADYRWQARLWDTAGVPGPWSAPASFSTGMSSWVADWISGPPQRFDRDLDRPIPLLRRCFTLPRAPRRARLHITALGLYHARINGIAVTGDRLRPGWTDYRVRVPSQTYDVTELLGQGENAIGVVLADGWYAGHIGLTMDRQWYGEAAAALVTLVVEAVDATSTVVSDEEWTSTLDGPWRSSSLLRGETFDARRELTGWDAPSFDDSSWLPVRLRHLDRPPRPVPTDIPPVREVETIGPISVSTPVFRTFVYDFGQNLTGWVRLRTKAVHAGTEVTVSHGEVVDAAGLPYVANLRLADSIDRYVTSSETPIFEPLFTLHGFRYAAISGLAEPPELVEAVVVCSDLRPAGRLTTSDARLNRLTSNIAWSARANHVEVPTDCPQRNERLGWLGDARIFLRTAAFNFDVEGIYRRWLADVRSAASADGMFPDFAPALPGLERDGAPGWADAGVFIPSALYEIYGDDAVLADSYESMRRYVELLHASDPDGIRRHRTGMSWGDWLSWPEPGTDAGRGLDGKLDSVYSTTDFELFATAFLVRSTDLLARAAGVLGHADDARRFEALADRARSRFREVFVTDDGDLTCGTQTAYLLAVAFHLAPEHNTALVEGLLAAIRRHDGMLSTGITGTELLLPVLTEHGHDDLAFQLLTEQRVPSWLGMVNHGATTVWERWDSWTPDSGFQDIRMNSFNHSALGSVGAWMYETIGGIKPLAPGFSRVEIRPRLGPLAWARCVVETASGRIAVATRRAENGLAVHVHVPASVSARAESTAGPVELAPGCHRLSLMG